LFRSLKRRVADVLANARLPRRARDERDRDLREGLYGDAGPAAAMEAAVDWLAIAQDRSRTTDSGVARHFSLIDGWGSSYPETTGYIIPTRLESATVLGRPDLGERARRMLDWLVGIQLPSGGFQGGMIDQTPVVPVTFNTGQILLGLAAGVREFGESYRPAMVKAADWLVATMDPDGAWRSHPTPFAKPGEKTYETHVAWGLVEAWRVTPQSAYLEAARRNGLWALQYQASNGWFDRCCLSDPTRPLTHTLGYVLRGLIEIGQAASDQTLLDAADRTARGLLSARGENGHLPGRVRPDWSAAVPWTCLTGSVQIAACWILLDRVVPNPEYRAAARQLIRYVRRTVALDGPPETRGAVKGSFPVDGEYGRYQYLSWAAKFLIDACLLEQRLDST